MKIRMVALNELCRKEEEYNKLHNIKQDDYYKITLLKALTKLELLEKKATPTKPKYKFMDFNIEWFACPTCENDVTVYDVKGYKIKTHCCINCGQKLDWSDSNE